MSRVSVEDANHVLWHFGLGGFQPGSFVQALLVAVAKADALNRERLRGGFPGLVHAMDLAQYETDGLERLFRIAGRS